MGRRLYHPGFRKGQWVKFAGDIPGAHTVLGKVVGIFHPEGIFVVDKDGNDLLVSKNGHMEKMMFKPDEVDELEAVQYADEIPAKRLETASPEWIMRMMRKKGK